MFRGRRDTRCSSHASLRCTSGIRSTGSEETVCLRSLDKVAGDEPPCPTDQRSFHESFLVAIQVPGPLWTRLMARVVGAFGDDNGLATITSSTLASTSN